MGFKDLPKHDSETLKPFAQDYWKWTRRLERMPDEELFAIDLACERVSTTNCWYATYAAAQILAPLVRREREQRAWKAKKDELAASHSGGSAAHEPVAKEGER